MTKKAKKIGVDFLNPYTVVSELGLKKGDSIADFGSGAGHWALAMANVVGKEGKVYALDVRTEVLEVLDGHVKLDGLFQIKTIQADLEVEGSTELPDGSQDVVFCSNIMHQLKTPQSTLKEARRILKDKGRLIVVDWEKDAAFGPKNKIDKKDIKNLAKEAGFELKKDLNTGHAHYGLIFSRV